MAIGDKLFIADKATLDLVKADTTTLTSDTTLIKTLIKKMRSQVFKTTGTWTCPANCTEVYVTACAGGGGGGGSSDYVADYGYNTGGGGGAGDFTMKQALTVVPSTEYTITIGSGGSGGAIHLSGSAGGVTSFGALLSLTGGSPGTGVPSGNGVGGAGAGLGGSGTNGLGLSTSGVGGIGGAGLFGGNATPSAKASAGAGGGGGGVGSTSGGAGGAGYMLIEWWG